jgi:hypothetical protein
MWSENYMFCGYDRARDIAFYHHLGTLPHDPTQWGGMACIVLPDGAIFEIKDYGRGDCTAGPASPGLAFRCDEPVQRWTLTKAGVAYPATIRELTNGLLTDRGPVPVEAELAFTALAPLWDMGAQIETPAFHTHHQQAGTVTGRIRIADQELVFDGAGYRDHSVGPRDVRGLVSHVWVNAWMPSGRVFSAMVMSGLGGASLSAGYACLGDGLVDATPVGLPVWTGEHGDPGKFEVELQTAAGPVLASGITQVPIPWTLEAPNEILLGQDHGTAGALLAYSALSTITWDGEEGPGLLEMSRREEQ